MVALNFKGDISQSFQGTRIWVSGTQNWKLPTQLFSRILGKIINNCPPSKLFLFTFLVKVEKFWETLGDTCIYTILKPTFHINKHKKNWPLNIAKIHGIIQVIYDP